MKNFGIMLLVKGDKTWGRYYKDYARRGFAERVAKDLLATGIYAEAKVFPVEEGDLQ